MGFFSYYFIENWEIRIRLITMGTCLCVSDHNIHVKCKHWKSLPKIQSDAHLLHNDIIDLNFSKEHVVIQRNKAALQSKLRTNTTKVEGKLREQSWNYLSLDWVPTNTSRLFLGKQNIIAADLDFYFPLPPRISLKNIKSQS